MSIIFIKKLFKNIPFYLFFIPLLSCSNVKKTSYQGFGGESLGQETLDKYAPGKIESNKLVRIQKMLDIRAMSAGMIDSSGKNLYTQWSVTGSSQIWKVPGPLRFPTQLTGGEDRSSMKGMTPDGRYLIISRDSGGDEMPGLYLQSTKGGPLVEIFRKAKTQSFLSYITADSKTIYFRANDRDPKSYALYRFDLRSKTTTLVFDGRPSGYWVMNDYWKDGTLLLSVWKGNAHSEYYLYHEKSKKLVPVLGQGEQEEYLAYFGRTKNELIVRSNKFSEYRRLYRYQVKTKKFNPITKNNDYDIEGMDIDRKRTRLIYLTNKGGSIRPLAIGFKNFRPLAFPMPKSKKLLQVYNGSTSANGRFTTLKAVFTDSPGTTYVYDWTTQKLKRWTSPSIPEEDISSLPVPKLEYYITRDGTKVPMFVQRPKECLKKVCPVVVDFHGGPEAQSYPWFIASRKLYFERGYIYVEPNVRGSDGYGKTWLHADDGPKRLNVITDIEDAALFIKKEWARDGVIPKVAIKGGSYGGYSVFVAMTMFAGSYDAGIAIVGMSDLVSFLKNTAPYRRVLREAEYGYLDKDLEALKKLSPINYLNKIEDPILIIHGANDPRVPAGEAVQIMEAMTKNDLGGELILFPDEGHGVRKRKNRAVYLGHILKFLDKNLN